MPDKKPVAVPTETPQPLPVDVISSVPLSVQIAPESLASLGAPPAGTAEPVTPQATAAGGNPLGAGTPVNMTVLAPPPPAKTVAKGEGLTLAPTTTEADDKVTEGQRHINILWESSQSVISLAITLAVIYCQIYGIQSETLNNAFFFVVATYLQRTNHVRVGGVGIKPDEVYRGR